MKTKHFCILFVLILSIGQLASANMPVVMDYAAESGFPMVDEQGQVTQIYIGEEDYPVVEISAQLLDPGIVLQEIRVY